MSNAKIVKGEDITFKAKIGVEGSANCYDLTGLTAVVAKFVGSAGTVSVTLAAGKIALDGAAGGGVLAITLDEIDTAALATGENNWQLEITKGTEIRIVQFLTDVSQGVDVKASLF